MATMYAWSNFPVERNEFGQTTKVIKPGDKISQSDIKVSDEEWEEYVKLGTVREEEYPDVAEQQSPAEYYEAHPVEAEVVDMQSEEPAKKPANKPANK